MATAEEAPSVRRKLDVSHKRGSHAGNGGSGYNSKLAAGPEPGRGFTFERTRTMAKLDSSPVRKGIGVSSHTQQTKPADTKHTQRGNGSNGGGAETQQANNSQQQSKVDAFEQQWRERLGNQLYGVLSALHPELAGKITGMMLGYYSCTTLAELLASPARLNETVDEAVRLLARTDDSMRLDAPLPSDSAHTPAASSSASPEMDESTPMESEPGAAPAPGAEAAGPEAVGTDGKVRYSISFLRSICHSSAPSSSASSSGSTPTPSTTTAAAAATKPKPKQQPIFMHPKENPSGQQGVADAAFGVSERGGGMEAQSTSHRPSAAWGNYENGSGGHPKQQPRIEPVAAADGSLWVPAVGAAVGAAAGALLPGWQEAIDPATATSYYYCGTKVQWARPTATDAEVAQAQAHREVETRRRALRARRLQEKEAETAATVPDATVDRVLRDVIFELDDKSKANEDDADWWPAGYSTRDRAELYEAARSEIICAQGHHLSAALVRVTRRQRETMAFGGNSNTQQASAVSGLAGEEEQGNKVAVPWTSVFRAVYGAGLAEALEAEQQRIRRERRRAAGTAPSSPSSFSSSSSSRSSSRISNEQQQQQQQRRAHRAAPELSAAANAAFGSVQLAPPSSFDGRGHGYGGRA